jgi:translation initiation factor IF-3
MVTRLTLRPKAYSLEFDRTVASVGRVLATGSRVEIEIPLRGYETGHRELAKKVLDRLLGDLSPRPVIVRPLRLRADIGRVTLAPRGTE